MCRQHNIMHVHFFHNFSLSHSRFIACVLVLRCNVWLYSLRRPVLNRAESRALRPIKLIFFSLALYSLHVVASLAVCVAFVMDTLELISWVPLLGCLSITTSCCPVCDVRLPSRTLQYLCIYSLLVNIRWDWHFTSSRHLYTFKRTLKYRKLFTHEFFAFTVSTKRFKLFNTQEQRSRPAGAFLRGMPSLLIRSSATAILCGGSRLVHKIGGRTARECKV